MSLPALASAPRVQLRAANHIEAEPATVRPPADDPFGMHLLGTEGEAGVHAAAHHGIAGGIETLPHGAAIQMAFGHHDVSGIAAHVGGQAATAAEHMGAEAFATGHHVAFRQTPDLHTAAHEAAHVIQQRSGVHLKGGVGEVGDVHERAADEVADRVVRGESAEPLLDTLAGAAGSSSTPQVQQRKGDFASLRKGHGAPRFQMRFKGHQHLASIGAQTADSVTFQVEDEQCFELDKSVIEGVEFELLDQAVKPDLEAEARLARSKSEGLETTFRAFVEGASKVPLTEEHLEIVRKAHNPRQPVYEFAHGQLRYQTLLKDTLGLSLGQIMDFHRSAGFEYEFGRFYDPQRPHIRQEPELLRSHVTLALSPVFSPLFEGRAAYFRLETDSRNCLELVTPPFLSLICGETGELLAALHTLFSETTVALGHQLEATRPPEEAEVEEEEKEDNANEPMKCIDEKIVGVPICDQLALLAQVVGGGAWKWEAEDPQTRRFCFAIGDGSSKHGGKAYGQANISMTPEEIIATAAMLPEWNLEQSRKGTTKANVKSVPTKLSEELFNVVWAHVTNREDERLRGAITLYTRSASNLAGIPSILYRRASGERPEEGNLATEIKETLLLWVKDFPHAVIADCLCDTDSADGFIQALQVSKDDAWPFILEVLQHNVQVLRVEAEKKINLYASSDYYMAYLQGPLCAPQNKLTEMRQFQRRTHPSQIALADGLAAATDAIHQAEAEYRNMVDLQVASVTGKPYVKRHTQDEGAEEFGEGHGVRKDTYLDRSPGGRRLRVAEIRDTSHLSRLEKIL